jgi:hypothetical protein
MVAYQDKEKKGTKEYSLLDCSEVDRVESGQA